jgi:hypothetical protein
MTLSHVEVCQETTQTCLQYFTSDNITCWPPWNWKSRWTCQIDLIAQTTFSEKKKLWSFLLCSFLDHTVTWSLWGPNILPSSLFTNTWSSSPNTWDHVLHPYKIKGKIIIPYILIFKFFHSRQEITKWLQAFPESRHSYRLDIIVH